MTRVRTVLQFVGSVVIVGILVNLATDYLGTRFPPARNLLVQIALIGLALWLLILVIRYVALSLTGGRYAVEALILNEREELLLYYHPHHKRMLPPGGRVKRSEFPNDALQLRLQERLGLSPRQYRFDDRFHHGLRVSSGNLGHIQRFAAPFLVQSELHRQRSFVRFHYDLIYILNLVDEHATFDGSKYRPVHFVDLEALKEMVTQRRSFPDVLDAYTRALAIIAKADK